MNLSEINLAKGSHFKPEYLINNEEELKLELDLGSTTLHEAREPIFSLPKNDELNIKPITKGLGLNDKRIFSKNNQNFVKSHSKKTVAQANDNLKRAEYLRPFYEDVAESRPLKTKSKEFALQEDPKLYPLEKEILSIPPKRDMNSKNLESKATQVKNVSQAPALHRLGAWLIDTLVVACVYLLVVGLFSIASGTAPRTMLSILFSSELIIFSLFQIFFFYIAYFTLMDLSSGTIGKEIIGLRLERYDGQKLTIKNTFVRSTISFVSALSFFFPNFLDFQGKLSDTKLATR